MTTNEKQNKQPEAGKKELTPRQIQMRKKMVVFPLFFLAFAGCMWLIFSPGEKEREEPSAGFNTELPTPESEGILSDKRDAYVQEEMRRREREKMRSLQDFAFGMEDEEEEPVMPAAVPDKSSGSAGGSSGAFRTSRAAYADINRQLGSFYEDTAGETGEEREMQARIEELERRGVRVKVSDISDALNLPRPGVTRTVKEMEQKGYLTKKPSEEDARIMYLSITDEGKKLSAKYNEQVFNALLPDLEAISREDAECTIRTIERFYRVMCERRNDLDK